MSAILPHAAFHQVFDVLDGHFPPANDLMLDPVVALVTGGAVLGMDGEVHIDLDRSHLALSAIEARHFAAEVSRIADKIAFSRRPADDN
ncbi:MAG TPA: hypothetical protein VEK34_08485 [Methylocella sp.]|nr:hypothetical protein [Methylocella sp.]